MKRQIAIYLTLSQSQDVISLLASKGFAIYRNNRLLNTFTPVEVSPDKKIIDFHHWYNNNNNEDYCGFLCLYNGDSSLEEMNINRRQLEREPAVTQIDDFFQSRHCAP